MVNVLHSVNTEQEIYNAALLAMCSENTKYDAVSQMSMFINTDALLSIVDVFGGTSIYIPTKSELETYLKSVIIVYYCISKCIEPGRACEDLNIKYTDDIKRCVSAVRRSLGVK